VRRHDNTYFKRQEQVDRITDSLLLVV